MRRSYYDKNLKIFILGMLAGAIQLTLFLYLKKTVGEGVAWAINAGLFGMLCAAWGMSNILRKIHKIDEEALGTVINESQLMLPPREPARCESGSDGVVFPYPTRALQAASLAAVRFWVEYDRDRPPLQKTVQGFLTEQGIPARQAVELASAIKPDSMSDTPDTTV